MRKIFIIVILFSIFVSSITLADVSIEDLHEIEGHTYYQDLLYTGKAIKEKDRYYYKEGKANGTWLFFYKNGNIRSIENWSEGRLDGKYILYLEDGTKSMQTFYHRGKDNGEYRLYYPNGNLRIRGFYEEGKPKGVWEYYYENGKLKAKSKQEL